MVAFFLLFDDPCFVDTPLGAAHVSEFQADPMYFLYYHNQRPVDRRLPVPIIKSHFPGLPAMLDYFCKA